MIWFHNWRLRSNYRRWQNLGNELDCGFALAREIHGPQFLELEYRIQKHANALRRLGEYVPPVPGEKGWSL